MKNNLNKVKEYNKQSSTHDKNKEIKILSKWLSHQQENYKKKEKWK